ncbi:hypothetical protein O1611_g4052 [Lasiodiplodia mahajangana]|uniref:Uncharacterized protein n=1 Tax=Lasiodiplodia mahajangana TaxID=1108764 RepID=A0ACC2JQE0_9PEZI|nr:hypothetical protein O1611_g4052 [Lasiodiplodia mahajangana]
MPVDTPSPVDVAMANAPSNASSNGRSRAPSTSSDRQSIIGAYNLMSPPLSVSPDAGFIAASAASQIVTNDHDVYSGTWYDQVGIEPAAETALVSNGALQLANNFVDQLLFNILATAKSTTLASLRSAVVDILKPKLAKDVINSADEELREYLGGGEIENLARSAPEVGQDWDLELVWKRTRLRCMVYSSLGDMEEEDEDYYIEQEHLIGEAGDMLTEIVSPAVAIFLTSILEFIGEQVLVVAGQAAFNRLCAKYEKELKEGTRLPGDICDRIVVEELDMERVALDRTFGRLWQEAQKPIESEDDVFDPAALPLPDSDVEATYSDEEESEEEELAPRPKSWFVASHKQDAGTLNVANISIKRTPSLPSRKKPRYSATSPTESAFNTEKDESPAERAEAAIALDSAEIGSEVETTVQTEPKLDELVDKATPSVAPIGGAVSHNLAGVDAQVDHQEDETDDEIEELAEEPEILTSSRISVGELSSPTLSESGRPSSIILTRSSSVRSVRVIEVQAPRSRASSIESNPRSPTPRSFSISREGSISRTPPIVEENDPHDIPYVTVTKTTPGYASSPAEVPRDMSTTLAPPPRNRSPPKPTRSPVNIPTSVPTKVIVHSNAAGPQQEDRYDNFQRPVSGLRNPPMPTLPERSTSRPVYVPTTPTQHASPESPRLPRPPQNESSSPARFKPKRTSEESSSNRSVDVARNFEELIQSNETLQYTLTPENMRDMGVSNPLEQFESDLIVRQSQSQPNGSPNASQRTRKSVDSKARERSRSSSITRSLSVTKTTGLASHPPTDMVANGKYGNATSKALPPVSSRNRTGPVAQARDARVPRESIQDFADFIRSTGPPGVGMPRTNGSFSGSSNPARSIAGHSITKSSSMEVRRGPKLQARDAVVNTSSESSELIDFIRRGPPSTNGNNHRIPRTVAPFRNTQDSDYMTSAVGGKAVDAIIPNVRTSQASTNITEASAPSSMNSQSALLNKSNGRQIYTGNNFDEDDMMPKRTRRHIRDPYAIDYSDGEDDDDDQFDPNPRPPPKKEESLIDFLNNYPPPPEPLVQPIVPPKKKSSAPNLIARLRAGSSSGLNGPGHSRKGSIVSDSRSLSSRMGPRTTHTPIVVPEPPESPRVASYGRVPMKKFEPREASFSRSQTTDLANFLRDSQPPPSMPAFSPSEEKASSGFSRMFERRKKPAF